MNEKKREEIKQKIKFYAPTVIAFAAATAAAIITVKTLKTALPTVVVDHDWELPVISGDEKAELLGRENLVIQQVEPDFYFLSVTNPEN